MQCIAKTSKNRRCQRQCSRNQLLCHQHNTIFRKYISQRSTEKTNQHGGFLNPISILSVMIPSCLDVVQCNWIVDATSAIPGLSTFIGLMKL
jgi:hypothetical protein